MGSFCNPNLKVGDIGKWVSRNCPRSCGTCECKDSPKSADDCPDWTAWCPRGNKGHGWKQWMNERCANTCGMCRIKDSLSCIDISDDCTRQKCTSPYWAGNCA